MSCQGSLGHPAALPNQAQTTALRDFLRSWQLPSNPSHYRSQIASWTAILEGYDSEISRLGEALEGLILRRSKVQDYIDGCQSALAPVRRVPPEILGKIFTSFLPPSQKAQNPSQELENIGNFELMQLATVCSHWHGIIMGTPSLWFYIAINLDCWPETAEEATSFMHLLDASLERGAGHLLKISLHGYNPSSAVHRSALTLLAKHCRRWLTLDLFVHHFAYLKDFSPAEGQLTSLRSLFLRSFDRQPTEQNTIFATAPVLNEVYLCSPDPSRGPRLPWDQLRSITYNADELARLGALQAVMRKISHPDAAFELRGWYPCDTWGSSSDILPQITSPITSFLVEICTTMHRRRAMQVLGDLFACLAFSQLRKLHLCRGTTSTVIFWPVDQFTALSTRSSLSHTLRTLDISHVTITENELVSSLVSLTSLERLFISDQEVVEPESLGGYHRHILVTDVLLSRLILTLDPDSRLVPHLKYFDCTSFLTFSTDAYLDFAMSRMEHAASFQNILHDFSNNSYQFDRVDGQSLVDFVAEHRIADGENDSEETEIV